MKRKINSVDWSALDYPQPKARVVTLKRQRPEAVESNRKNSQFSKVDWSLLDSPPREKSKTVATLNRQKPRPSSSKPQKLDPSKDAGLEKTSLSTNRFNLTTQQIEQAATELKALNDSVVRNGWNNQPIPLSFDNMLQKHPWAPTVLQLGPLVTNAAIEAAINLLSAQSREDANWKRVSAVFFREYYTALQYLKGQGAIPPAGGNAWGANNNPAAARAIPNRLAIIAQSAAALLPRGANLVQQGANLVQQGAITATNIARQSANLVRQAAAQSPFGTAAVTSILAPSILYDLVSIASSAGTVSPAVVSAVEEAGNSVSQLSTGSYTYGPMADSYAFGPMAELLASDAMPGNLSAVMSADSTGDTFLSSAGGMVAIIIAGAIAAAMAAGPIKRAAEAAYSYLPSPFEFFDVNGDWEDWEINWTGESKGQNLAIPSAVVEEVVDEKKGLEGKIEPDIDKHSEKRNEKEEPPPPSPRAFPRPPELEKIAEEKRKEEEEPVPEPQKDAVDDEKAFISPLLAEELESKAKLQERDIAQDIIYNRVKALWENRQNLSQAELQVLEEEQKYLKNNVIIANPRKTVGVINNMLSVMELAVKELESSRTPSKIKKTLIDFLDIMAFSAHESISRTYVDETKSFERRLKNIERDLGDEKYMLDPEQTVDIKGIAQSFGKDRDESNRKLLAGILHKVENGPIEGLNIDAANQMVDFFNPEDPNYLEEARGNFFSALAEFASNDPDEMKRRVSRIVNTPSRETLDEILMDNVAFIKQVIEFFATTREGVSERTNREQEISNQALRLQARYDPFPRTPLRPEGRKQKQPSKQGRKGRRS